MSEEPSPTRGEGAVTVTSSKSRHTCHSRGSPRAANSWSASNRRHSDARPTRSTAMFDIMHRVGVKAAPRDVYAAVTSRERLAAWWTSDTRGRSELGRTVHFQFGDRGFFDMKVLELQPAQRV